MYIPVSQVVEGSCGPTFSFHLRYCCATTLIIREREDVELNS